jgi:hypothetical protein
MKNLLNQCKNGNKFKNNANILEYELLNYNVIICIFTYISLVVANFPRFSY